MIPYSSQIINKDDIIAVKKVLKSKFITQGPLIELFEKKLAKKVKARFSVAVNSATSALHIACLALGLKKKIGFGLFQIHLSLQIIPGQVLLYIFG